MKHHHQRQHQPPRTQSNSDSNNIRKSMKIVGQLQFTYKITENLWKSLQINESQWKL